MKLFDKNQNLFHVLLLIVVILYFFNILVFHINFNELIGTKGLRINYDGGFVRRGLLGEIITSLSLNFNFEIKNVFTFLHISNYLIFFYLNYLLFNIFKKNFLFYFFIFSPLYFFYPLIAVTTKFAEHVIQREIYVITFFLIYTFLCLKIHNRNINFLIGIIFLTFLTFLYELTILCFPFFFTIYYIFLKRNKYQTKFYEIFISSGFCLLIIVFHLYNYGESNIELVVENLNRNFNFNFRSDDLLYSWLNQEISKQIIFFMDGFKINYILRYIFYAHPILLLIFINYKFVKDKIFLFLFISSISLFCILFGIATDWARFVHILYTLSLITFTFYHTKNSQDIFLKSGNLFLEKFKISQNFANTFVIIYCLIWNLKHTFWQNHLSFAFIKIFQQNMLYFNELIF